jgi:hypothetical protein
MAYAFARHGFIKSASGGLITFHYRGWHHERVRDRITVSDVAWTCELVSQLTDRQWYDAFRERDAALFNVGFGSALLTPKKLCQNSSPRLRRASARSRSC